MPSLYASSGVFYTPGAITGGNGLSDVARNFFNNLKATPIINYLNGFFTLGVAGSSCPTWQFSIPLPVPGTWDFSIDFLCWPSVLYIADVLGLFVLFFAGYRAFHIAFH